MIELKEGINYHNFLLDSKPRNWFNKSKEESTGDWLSRVSYQTNEDALNRLRQAQKDEYWLKESVHISVSVLSFLRKNKIEKSVFEELCGFELNFKQHDWKLSEIKRLELLMNIKLF